MNDPQFFDPRLRRKIPRALSEEEVAMMITASRGDKRDNMVIRCLYFFGLTNSELQNLRARDINLVKRILKVKDRELPIPQDFLKDLGEWIQGKDIVFTGRSRGKLSDRHIRRIIKSRAKEANVRKYEEIHPHTLRHSFATHLQNSGVPLNIIQNMLGHERAETTAIYTHMGVEKAREWIEKAFTRKE